MEKEIRMWDIVDFCDRYNSIGYGGEAEIIELESCFIIKLYNAGFSENEELDTKFKEKYANCIILDRHPILIFEFSKLNLKNNYHVVGFGNLKNWCDCYKKEKIFKHLLQVW
jgi:hypothetical protein